VVVALDSPTDKSKGKEMNKRKWEPADRTCSYGPPPDDEAPTYQGYPGTYHGNGCECRLCLGNDYTEEDIQSALDDEKYHAWREGDR